jgi:hypothetical protein
MINVIALWALVGRRRLHVHLDYHFHLRHTFVITTWKDSQGRKWGEQILVPYLD